jgi:hypothetical protein
MNISDIEEKLALNRAAAMASIFKSDSAEFARLLLESHELERLLENLQATRGVDYVAPLRGRKPTKREQIAARMRADMEQGLRLEDLKQMKQEALATKYKAARGTCVKALAIAAVKMSRK